ncbi:NAD(P)-dependent alcohol dehydrogenase [Nocardioides guangzhouensis]|uniref:NAD(P)-dependent alcohol dehydrogenase n=1 Tax=Nocardioides guangzhouensis TaxID=2497878 RepID=A0A4Q4Z174_9ACTN|nr:NAD(P)-dependent alcohol dehydrogenase [Nocardioides guangzhouensis]RYP81212.1 NAD(P)-dependent alcohol dehydrogenase [Nocardioides guangzhouensis]
MKAVRLHQYDERPVVEEVAEPEVTGAFDVVVRIGGAGLCRTDLHIVEGQWAAKSNVALPYTLGHENAGWVHAVGPAVQHLRPGEPVILHPLVTCGFCHACRAGDDVHCADSLFPGIDIDGGMAELVKTSARSVVKLPAGVEPASVAALADAGLTAYHAVKKAVPLAYPGSTCVVVGAGGLGHIGIQCLRALSATRIVVLDRNEEALSLTRDWGADETVVVDGSHVERVLELTDGNGAEVVLDFVGERGAERDSWAMTRRAGSDFVIGYGGSVDVPTIDVISTERNLIGNLVGSYNDLVELMVLAADGRVEMLTQTYPLEAVNDAMDDLDAGRLRGRGILVPTASGG